MLETMGWVSLIPIVIAIVLSLVTKNTVVYFTIAGIICGFISGKGIWGLKKWSIDYLL